ncbi:MAG: helix-turn-helix domain-containing protein [Sphingobacteriaceae bacterium]|nr:helix-turn-helix domain-containing protein [Sphingobacteriaceae bacterium]
MHTEVVKKIKRIRIEKGISPLQMSEKLNIDPSAYTRLEAGKTLTWAKYLEEILNVFELSPELFFKDIGSSIKITNREGSYGGVNMHVENLYADNKEKMQRIEELYQQRLQDKDLLILQLQKMVDKFTS